MEDLERSLICGPDVGSALQGAFFNTRLLHFQSSRENKEQSGFGNSPQWHFIVRNHIFLRIVTSLKLCVSVPGLRNIDLMRVSVLEQALENIKYCEASFTFFYHAKLFLKNIPRQWRVSGLTMQSLDFGSQGSDLWFHRGQRQLTDSSFVPPGQFIGNTRWSNHILHEEKLNIFAVAEE